MSRVARALGTFYFLRGRGTWFVELVRGWLAPAGVAGGLTKYLGADTAWSLAVAAGIPIVVECLGYLLGRFLYQRGGIEQDYLMALTKDPYRQESLDLFRQISQDLAALRQEIEKPL